MGSLKSFKLSMLARKVTRTLKFRPIVLRFEYEKHLVDRYRNRLCAKEDVPRPRTFELPNYASVELQGQPGAVEKLFFEFQVAKGDAVFQNLGFDRLWVETFRLHVVSKVANKSGRDLTTDDVRDHSALVTTSKNKTKKEN